MQMKFEYFLTQILFQLIIDVQTACENPRQNDDQNFIFLKTNENYLG